MPGEIGSGLGAAGNLELGEDPRHVFLDGLRRELQVDTDLPVRLAAGHLAEDALLLGRKPRQAFVAEQVLALAKAVENAFRYRGVEQVLTGADGPKGPPQVSTLDRLEHVSGRPGHDRS